MLSSALSNQCQARVVAGRRISAPKRASVSRFGGARFSRFTVRAAVDKGEVLEGVRSIISEQLGVADDKVSADSKFADLGADSLDTVEIMMALEEKFEIELDEEGAEKISTVQEAAELIAEEIERK